VLLCHRNDISSTSIFVPHKQKSSKIGRPRLPKGQAKGFIVRARMSPAEYNTVKDAAHKLGEGVSQWARDAMLKVAAIQRQESF
jgi:hypothetical protein